MSLVIGPGITLGAGVNIDPTYAVATSGLVVNLDASEFSSSPAAGATWTNTVTGPTFTLPNGATYSPINGSILTFDRASQQSAHGTSPGSALTTFTAETWVRLNAVDNTAGEATCTITEVYGSTPINYSITNGLAGNPNVWQGGYYGGNGDWHVAGNFIPTADTWYCMAVTYDGATIRFYVNGELNEAAASAVTPTSSGLGIHVGERWDAPSFTKSFLDGSIPVVRLYDRALSPTEIKQNYLATNSRFNGLPTNGLQLFLDSGNPASYSGTGSTWTDLSGQGYTASINSGMTYSASNGGIFNFDGTSNAFAQIGSGFGYDYSAGITINVWAKFDTLLSGGDWERLIDFGNDAGGPTGYNLIVCRQQDTSEINTTIDAVNADSLNPGRMAITWDGWAMYTLYADGTYWKQYKNGEFYSYQANSDVPATVTRNLNYIGKSNWAGDAYYQGSMSVIQLYNRALTEPEIAQCYNYFKGRFGL